MFVSENELNDVNKYALPDSGQNFSDHCAIKSSEIVTECILENVDVVNAIYLDNQLTYEILMTLLNTRVMCALEYLC